MLPYEGIIIIILSLIGMYKSKYKMLSLGFLIFGLFLVLSNLMSYIISLINMNKRLHPELINLLENENQEYRNNQLIALDAIEPNIVKVVKDSGNSVLSHHSFGYKKDNLGFVGNSTLSKLYEIPFTSKIIHNFTQTQTMNIKEQIKSGITNFDIRFSKVGDKVYVDHGEIFGELQPLLEELYTSIPDYVDFTMYCRPSKYSSNTNYYEILTGIILPISKKYPKKYGNTFYNQMVYIQTSDNKQLVNFIKNEPTAPIIAAIVTPTFGYIIINSLYCLLISITASIILFMIIINAKSRGFYGLN